MQALQEPFAALAGRPVFVTGAGGFIGGALARTLAARGARVRALVRGGAAARALAAAGVAPAAGRLGPGAEPALAAALAGCETLFHFAHDMRAGAAENCAAFASLLAAAHAAGVRRILLASSIVVCDGWPGQDLPADPPAGLPPGPPAGYRAGKLAMEAELRRFARETGVAAAILRPTLVYGPESRLWTAAIAERLLAGPVMLPAEAGLAHPVFVDDVVAAAARAAVAPGLAGEAFTLSGPAPADWAEWHAAHAAILGRGRIVRVPAADLRARLGPEPAPGAAPARPAAAARASALARRLLGSDRVDRLAARFRAVARRSGERPHYPDRTLLALYLAHARLDLSAARDRLGHVPATDLAAGMAATAPWLRARYGSG
jgi:nucleoside-diphosphate-sugar epimerase